MCRVDELIKRLQEYPENTEVRVLEIDSTGYTYRTAWGPLELPVSLNSFNTDTFAFYDFTDDPLPKDGKQLKCQQVLYLGCE